MKVCNISLFWFSQGSAWSDDGWGGTLNGQLGADYVMLMFVSGMFVPKTIKIWLSVFKL